MKRIVLPVLACLALFLPGAALADEIVDLNKVQVKDFLDLPLAIEPELAEAIMAYREEKGAFTKPEDLMKVPGMDESSFDLLYPFMLKDKVVIEVEMPKGMSPY